jgi:hypothetical protein
MDQQQSLSRIGLCQRLFDGVRSWGSMNITPGRYGLMKYRLTLYPPGISDEERRWLRLWRGWPVWGVLAWVCLEIVLPEMTSPLTSIIIATAVYLGAGAAAFWFAGDNRRRVCTIVSVVFVGHHEPAATPVRDQLLVWADSLLRADAMLHRNEISTVEHEQVWSQVYHDADRLRTDLSQHKQRKAQT